MTLNRPLVMALLLSVVSLGAVVLARVTESPGLGAGLVATVAGPGVLVALFEALRTIDDRDPRSRRATILALVLMMVPLAALISFARSLGVEAPWSN